MTGGIRPCKDCGEQTRYVAPRTGRVMSYCSPCLTRRSEAGRKQRRTERRAAERLARLHAMRVTSRRQTIPPRLPWFPITGEDRVDLTDCACFFARTPRRGANVWHIVQRDDPLCDERYAFRFKRPRWVRRWHEYNPAPNAHVCEPCIQVHQQKEAVFRDQEPEPTYEDLSSVW